MVGGEPADAVRQEPSGILLGTSFREKTTQPSPLFVTQLLPV